MAEKPWLRPLPALILMSCVGFWASFFTRESGQGVLVAALAAVWVASPVYYLAYALVLVIRRRRGKPGANATPLGLRVVHQVTIFVAIGVAAAVSWVLLVSFALVFGAPPSVISDALTQAGLLVALYCAITCVIVLLLEAIYSLTSTGKSSDAAATSGQ